MSIKNIIEMRSIKEVLHFTTNQGVLGILYSTALKARRRLDSDKRLEHIFTPNTRERKYDSRWTDYINLSITKINSSFFSVSAGAWHKNEGLWWCILSFSPEILEHAGVYFTTTNNIYSNVSRGTGLEALVALFADRIPERPRVIKTRQQGCPENYTTCEQAEVLYPGELSTKFLQKIYVQDGDSADQLKAQIAGVMHLDVPIEINPSYFRQMQ